MAIFFRSRTPTRRRSVAAADVSPKTDFSWTAETNDWIFMVDVSWRCKGKAWRRTTAASAKAAKAYLARGRRSFDVSRQGGAKMGVARSSRMGKSFPPINPSIRLRRSGAAAIRRLSVERRPRQRSHDRRGARGVVNKVEIRRRVEDRILSAPYFEKQSATCREIMPPASAATTINVSSERDSFGTKRDGGRPKSIPAIKPSENAPDEEIGER